MAKTDSNKPFNLILKNISRYILLSEEEETIFTFIKYTFSQTQAIYYAGRRSFSASCFVNSGCLRAYNIDKNGTEHILQFAPPDGGLAIFIAA